MEQGQRQFSIWYFVVAFMLLVLIQDMFFKRHVETLAYSDFKALLAAKKVSDVVVGEKTVAGKFSTDGLETVLTKEHAEAIKTKLGPGQHGFTTLRVEDPALAGELQAAGIRYSGQPDGGLLKTVLSWVAPALVFVLIWTFAMRRMGAAHGVMEIGKSKAKVYVEKDTKVTFADVAGVDEAKEELKETVNFLKDPRSYGRLGARMPKGVLLVGPPGTGKTLLARAVAGEAGVPFFSISGSEFVEMFVGVGAARVRDLFEQARQKAPAIIFIDELDALGRARGTFGGLGGHDEKEQTLAQLLAELDGFDPSSGLVLLAATNRPEILDPALLRAGRFDRQILVDRPDKNGRIQILEVHLRRIKRDPALSVEEIAALTPGFTGAELANLVNEAALAATRRNADAVNITDFTVAIERIVAGLEKKNRLLNPAERRVVAHHELGHAIVAMALPGADPVHKVSIIPRGIGALGYTMQRPTEDRFLMTRGELETRMTVLLGGRAAEQLIFGELSTGAADDLQKATEIARNMVARFGMDPELGHASYARDSGFLGVPQTFAPREYSEDTARRIDDAVRALVQSAFERALGILRRNRAGLERGAELLIKAETLGEAQLAELPIERAEPAGAAPEAAAA